MGQTFLGRQCTYGEDRALTNYILDRGYNTVYQRSALVRTVSVCVTVQEIMQDVSPLG